ANTRLWKFDLRHESWTHTPADCSPYTVEKFPQWSSGAVLATLQSACSDCSGEAVGERKDDRESPGKVTMEQLFPLRLKRIIKGILYPSLFALGVFDRLIEKHHHDKVVV